MQWSDGAPLQNVKVLDLCRVVSGPFATMLLGDLGADVLNGDGGENVFLYKAREETDLANRDRIYSFDIGSVS